MTTTYRWRGGEEAMLGFALDATTRLIIFQPLFEEANRTRHMIVSVMRALAEQGIGTALPDLPGTGESLVDLDQVSLRDWRDAAAAAGSAASATATVAFRGGAIIDDAACCPFGWRLSPETGPRLARDLERASMETLGDGRVRVAGNIIQVAFLEDLKAALPLQADTVRTARLSTEAADADAKLPGTPLWRRAEPGDDATLEAAIVADIVQWVASCAGR